MQVSWTASRCSMGLLGLSQVQARLAIILYKAVVYCSYRLADHFVKLIISASRGSCYMQYLGCRSKYWNTQYRSAAHAVGRRMRNPRMHLLILFIIKMGRVFARFSRGMQL